MVWLYENAQVSLMERTQVPKLLIYITEILIMSIQLYVLNHRCVNFD